MSLTARFDKSVAKARIRAFLSIRGNRQLVLSASSLLGVVAVAMFATTWWTTRAARLYAEEHAVELRDLDAERQQLAVEVADLSGQAAGLRSRLVTVAQADEFRNEVIGLIRDNGCRLRSVTPGDHEVRRWMEDDELESDGFVLDDFEEEPLPTPFSLVSQSLNVQVSGSFENIRRLIDAVQALNRAAQTRTLVVQADSELGLLLDWDLLFYDLEPVGTLHNW